jgi:glycosyltransferase involved in cell wall biosynthesis
LMKIAIHVDGPVIRGNEAQAIVIADGLRRRGHNVVVSCRGGGPVERRLVEIGIETTGIRPRGDADLWSAMRFARWLRRERFDAVLLTSWVRAFIAGLAARRAGVPRVVFRIGALQPVHERRRGYLDRYALRHWYHEIIANSQLVADRMFAALPDSTDRIHVVLNGVAEVGIRSAVDLRRELDVPQHDLLAVAVGGLELNKGFEYVIDAVATVEGVHAVLVGGGPAARREELEELAARRGIGDRVHLIGRREDVPDLLAACNLFVLSSRSEGFSVACLEAMRAGLPVIATDVGGTREALAPGEGRGAAGWVVPRMDGAALGAALREVVSGLRAGEPEVAARRVEADWRVRNWFTVERMIDGYEAVLTGNPVSRSAFPSQVV